MLKTNKFKKKPLIEISDKESTFTFSPPSPTPGLVRTGEKRGHPRSSREKEKEKPAQKTTKTTTTNSIPSVSFPPISPEQHL